MIKCVSIFVEKIMLQLDTVCFLIVIHFYLLDIKY